MEADHYEQPELWGEAQVFMPENLLPRYVAVQELLDGSPATVVDVGAGDGRVLHHLAAAGVASALLAADRSRAALRHVDAPAAQASIDALPFADRSVAVAICCEVLEHLPPPIYDNARHELARIAREAVIITVPNRERRARADITCGACGCRYNADRHLRSFTPADLDGLLEGFTVERVVETGPRQPVYPRQARLLLERSGFLRRPGSPSCPQCGTRYEHAAAAIAASTGRQDADGAGRGYSVARRLLPKARHPYFLCARLRRVG